MYKNETHIIWLIYDNIKINACLWKVIDEKNISLDKVICKTSVQMIIVEIPGA